MPPLVLVAAALVVGSVVTLGYVSVAGRSARRHVGGNLVAGLGGTVPVTTGPQAGPPSALAPLVRAMDGTLSPRSMGRLQQRIIRSGRLGTSVEKVLADKVLWLLVLGALGGLLWVLSPSTGRLVLWGGLAALGWYLPDLTLANQGQKRTQAIQLALPDTLDQMMISVQAGLGFDAAMHRVARANHGPLAQELSLVQHEVRLGMHRTEALRRLGQRSGCTDLKRFVSAVVQSDRYGIPIADILEVQAGQLRELRRQRAEERAMKIPVKIIFPLVLCILPSLFVVLLGPAALRIARDLL